MIQFRAHLDGKNICPDEPVSLPEGVTLRVSVEGLPSGKPDDEGREPPTALRPAELFAHIESKVGLHDHPADWSAEHDHYLYGAPKPVSLPEGVTLRVSVSANAETLETAHEIPDHDGWDDLSRLIAQSQISTGISDLAQEHDQPFVARRRGQS